VHTHTHTYCIHQSYGWNFPREKILQPEHTVGRNVTCYVCLYFPFKHKVWYTNHSKKLYIFGTEWLYVLCAVLRIKNYQPNIPSSEKGGCLLCGRIFFVSSFLSFFLYFFFLTSWLTYSLTYLLTHLLTYSLTNLLTHSLTHSLTYLLTHSLTHSLTYLLTYLLTCLLTYLHNYLLTH
jgi:hypothetical protein